MNDLKTLDEYLGQYGQLLARQAQESLRPLHIPGKDSLNVSPLLRQPFPAQAHVIQAAARLLQRDNTAWIIAEMGTGKGGLPTTKVLTPTGWITLGEISVGNVVVDPSNGTHTEVIGVHRRGVMPMYRVTFTDGASTVCSDDHLWAVRSPNQKFRGGVFKAKPLAALRQKLAIANGNLQHFIPMTAPIYFMDYPGRNPIAPYLLGAILGDGSLTGGTPSFCKPDTEIIDKLRMMLPAGVELAPKADSEITYYFTSGRGSRPNPLTVSLRNLDLYGHRAETKFVPNQYLYASLNDRIELLQGLLDTDGSPVNSYGIEYSTVSPRLAAAVKELVQSLGGLATTAENVPTYTYKGERCAGQLAYRLYITLPRHIQPFTLSRKAALYKPGDKYPPTRAIAKVEPYGDAECICISVASQSKLYVTDDYIVTHNSLISLGITQTIAHWTKRAGYNALVFCPGQLLEKWKREILETIPDAQVHILQDWREVVQMCNRQRRYVVDGSKGRLLTKFVKPVWPTWYIIARDRAKLGAKWRAAVAMRGDIPACTRCKTLCAKKAKEDMAGEEGLATEYMTLKDLSAKKHECMKCGERLWTYTHELDRAEPAKFIHKKMKGFFRYLVVDEAHEEKGSDTAQANALGCLAAAAKKTIALTGTLIGGYAEHLRPLLFRLSPSSLVSMGFSWDKGMPFNETYGRIETRIVEKDGEGNWNTQSRGGGRKKTKYVRPGIMPTLFGHHLMDKAVFLGLEEVAENLPAFKEVVTGCAMDAALAKEYERIEKVLADTIKDMVRKGDKRLLGPMLNVLLSYPDHPKDWSTIGYYDTNGPEKTFVPVVKPNSLDMKLIRSKEQAAVDIVLANKALGRQCWIYNVMSGEQKDVNERLASILKQNGLKVEILRASVALAKREEWIARNGPGKDVILSHPKLVETGLDLFDKGGKHNFPTLIFFSTGYNLFTLRQASRRAWRIGQRMPCEVHYLFYERSMQERAIALMGKKMAAAKAIEGKFSADGLVAMSGDDGAEMALARNLSERIEEGDAARHWQRAGVTNGKTGQVLTQSSFMTEMEEAVKDMQWLFPEMGQAV